MVVNYPKKDGSTVHITLLPKKWSLVTLPNYCITGKLLTPYYFRLKKKNYYKIWIILERHLLSSFSFFKI